MVNRGGVGAFVVRGRSAILLVLLALGGVGLLRHDLAQSVASRPAQSRLAQVQADFSALPLAFEPNQGQTDGQVKFLAHAGGYGLFLTQNEAVLSLPAAKRETPAHRAALRMSFAGADSSASVLALQPLPGRTNYLLGNDSSRWVRNVPQFARVQYRELYPGIDLDFYGKEGRLEYDFEVNPGADPNKISLHFTGANTVTVAANGDLELTADGRELRFLAPHIYQSSSGQNRDVAGSFVLRAANEVGFKIGGYDHSRVLIIDPVLSFSTYFGGTGGESCAAISGAQFVAHCPAVAVDSANRVYLAGVTTSATGFPAPASSATTLGPAGSSDVFVARISNNGSALALDLLTFIGGTGTDYPVGVAVDSGFNVYLAGNTSSGDFPTTSSGFQTSVPVAGNHAFFTELDSSFGNLLYSTFLAGNGVDTASDLALDSQGHAYIFGTTTSTTATNPFPTTLGSLQPTPLAANQFFFSKLNPSLSGPNSLLYSTFFGGSSPANGVVMGGGLAIDGNLNVYLAGGTNFTDMPIVNAFDGAEQGGLDVWAAKLAAPANNTEQYTPVYETYFGGSGDEVAYGVASDSGNTDMYITGSTTSTAIASVSTAPALQATYGGGASDAFLAKFGGLTTVGTTQGTVPLLYFTYLGGAGQDVGLSVVADTNQNAHLAGLTTSGSLANPNPLFQSPGGGTDAFFARLVTITTATTTVNTSSTSILGGSGTDIGTSVAVDSGLNSYIAGETTSANFPHASDPVVPNIAPLQASLAGASDAFLSKIGPNFTGLSFTCTGTGCPSPAPANPTVNPTPVGVGGTVTFTYSIYNLGDPVNGVILTDTLSSNSTIASGTTSTCTLSGVTEICNLGTVGTSSTTGSPAVTAPAATISIVATAIAPTATIPPSRPPAIGNSAVLSVAGTNFQATASGTATVNDFGVSVVGGNSQVVTAGNQAHYQIVVSPTGVFPGSVSLSCGSGLPSGVQCQFQGNNPITTLSNGAQNRTLDITTTPRVTTPASLFRSGPIYAFWLPVSGLALVGSGFSRHRRWLMAMLICAVLGTVALQAACSNTNGTSTTTGTPTGTYTITVNAISGGATRTTAVTLVVQ